MSGYNKKDELRTSLLERSEKAMDIGNSSYDKFKKSVVSLNKLIMEQNASTGNSSSKPARWSFTSVKEMFFPPKTIDQTLNEAIDNTEVMCQVIEIFKPLQLKLESFLKADMLAQDVKFLHSAQKEDPEVKRQRDELEQYNSFLSSLKKDCFQTCAEQLQNNRSITEEFITDAVKKTLKEKLPTPKEVGNLVISFHGGVIAYEKGTSAAAEGADMSASSTKKPKN